MWSESREHAGVRACWFEEREKERERFVFVMPVCGVWCTNKAAVPWVTGMRRMAQTSLFH